MNEWMNSLWIEIWMDEWIFELMSIWLVGLLGFMAYQPL